MSLSPAQYLGWLRGFLDGIGDNDPTDEQLERIITETSRFLPARSDGDQSPITNNVVVTAAAPRGRPKKAPATREEALAESKKIAKTEGPPTIGLDMPSVERMG